MGRVRSEDKFAPRPIDLDVIAFEDGSHTDPDLARYAHVAVPAADLAQNWEYEPGVAPLNRLHGQSIDKDSNR